MQPEVQTEPTMNGPEITSSRSDAGDGLTEASRRNVAANLDDLPDPREDILSSEASDDSGDERWPNDESPFTKTYIAIDGIERSEMADEDADKLEREIATLMLRGGYPITGVRVIDQETVIIENASN